MSPQLDDVHLTLIGSFELRCSGVSVQLPMSAQRTVAFLALHERQLKGRRKNRLDSDEYRLRRRAVRADRNPLQDQGPGWLDTPGEGLTKQSGSLP